MTQPSDISASGPGSCQPPGPFLLTSGKMTSGRKKLPGIAVTFLATCDLGQMTPGNGADPDAVRLQPLSRVPGATSGKTARDLGQDATSGKCDRDLGQRPRATTSGKCRKARPHRDPRDARDLGQAFLLTSGK